MPLRGEAGPTHPFLASCAGRPESKRWSIRLPNLQIEVAVNTWGAPTAVVRRRPAEATSAQPFLFEFCKAVAPPVVPSCRVSHKEQRLQHPCTPPISSGPPHQGSTTRFTRQVRAALGASRSLQGWGLGGKGFRSPFEEQGPQRSIEGSFPSAGNHPQLAWVNPHFLQCA